MFRERSGIPIPERLPTPKFGNERRKVAAAMPPLPISIDVNRIATSQKKQRVSDRLGHTPATSTTTTTPPKSSTAMAQTRHRKNRTRERPQTSPPKPQASPKTAQHSAKTSSHRGAPQPLCRNIEKERPDRSSRRERQDKSRSQKELDKIAKDAALDAAQTAKEQTRALIRIEETVVASLRIAIDAMQKGRDL